MQNVKVIARQRVAVGISDPGVMRLFVPSACGAPQHYGTGQDVQAAIKAVKADEAVGNPDVTLTAMGRDTDSRARRARRPRVFG